MFDPLFQDVRLALRSGRRRPVFALCALLTLGLGLGAGTAMFSVVRSILLSPLPFAAPDRLVALWPDHFFSNAQLEFLRERVDGVEGIAAFSPGWSMALSGSGEPRRLAGARVSAGFFSTLGVRPTLGRLFGPEAWFHRASVAMAVGRLRPDWTVERATGQLGGLVPALRAEFGQAPEGEPAAPLRDLLLGDAGGMLLLLFGASGLVLLIAGANFGNLLLVRALERGRELAVRAALGARRRRLLAQTMTESVVLALLGSALGVALGWVGLRLMRSILPPDTPRLAAVGMDPAVGVACVAAAVALGLAFGAAPGLLSTRAAPLGALRSRGGPDAGRAGQRARAALIVAEVALAMALSIGAGLMMRTLWNLSRVDLGFSGERVLTFQLQPSGGDEARRRYFLETMERLRSLPGVQAVGATNHLPLSGYSWSIEVEPAGVAPRPGDGPKTVALRYVAGDYFRALAIPLRAGRAFAATDDAGGPAVAVVNRAFAERFWPGQDPVGRRVDAGSGGRRESLTVVGVVGNVRHDVPSQPAPAELYRPISQQLAGAMTVAIRTAGDPLARIADARAVVHAVDPDVPFAAVQPLDRLVHASAAEPRLVFRLLVLFGAVGLALGAVGVYGVVAFAVSRRSHEFGVRLALGARRSGIVRMVVGTGARLAGLGAAVGIGLALALTRLLEGMMFGVDAADPATYAGMTALVLLVAAAASAIPAARAARVDPGEALRAD